MTDGNWYEASLLMLVLHVVGLWRDKSFIKAPHHVQVNGKVCFRHDKPWQAMTIGDTIKQIDVIIIEGA